MEHLKHEKGAVLKHDNAITGSRYNFSAVEKRCYYLVLEQVRKTHIEGKRGQKDLFDDLIVKIKAKDLERAGDNHTKVYRSLQTLREKQIYIETEDKKLSTGYLNYVEYDKKTNVYEVGVTHKIMPYLVELAEQYTSYNLVVAMSLKSEYSQRFYELCCQYRGKGKFYKSESQLRNMFMLENKYKNTYDLKNRTILTAQKELESLYNEKQSDLYFTVEAKDKDGKRELSWWFTIHDRLKPKDVKISYDDVYSVSHRLKLDLNKYFPRDKKYIQRVVNEMQLKPDIIVKLSEKVNRIIKNYPKQDVPKLIRFAMADDFGIK